MKRYIFIISIFVFSIGSHLSATYAATDFEVQSGSWSDSANKVLNLVEKQDYEGARVELKKLGDAFSKSNLADKNLTVDAIHQLSSLIINLQGSLSRLNPNEKEIMKVVTQLVLAFDAVSHPNKPQWKSYYNSLGDKVDAIQLAVKQGSKEDIVRAVKAFSDEYQILKPAIVVSKSPSTVNHLDSLVNFLQKATPKEITSNIDGLKELLQNVFLGSEKDVIAMFHPLNHLPIIIPMFSIIGFIVAILGIVSWKKHVLFTGR